MYVNLTEYLHLHEYYIHFYFKTITIFSEMNQRDAATVGVKFEKVPTGTNSRTTPSI